ncbi:MAG TPA: glycosyltransferase family 4 protein, partial [Devosia sp.]|nr:glycosyltransferase family 4 protein [Devosia sp.]
AVAGTGVDLAQWVALPPVTAPLTFTLAARLIREKGIEDFVEAARRIRRDDPRVRFVLLGGIDDNPGAIGRQAVQSWVDEGVVEWPGHVDVRRWLAETSVFVLPSVYREGVPRSIQEAMATGRAIITTDSPGCRETVVDGQNGFLVPPRDVAALAAAMQRFVATPDLVARMGRESRQLAEARFDVRKINRTLIEAMGL